MWSGVGGRVYWGRKEEDFVGIVVLFGWVSIRDKELKNFVDLYSSLKWNSLVCHADLLSAFSSERATSLAFVVLNELVEELRIRSCPIVLVAFSGGSKACMSKLLQILDGTCDGHIDSDENRLIRNCVTGHVYDSSPVDFTSDLAAPLALHQTILKWPGPSKLVSWLAKGVVSGLDALYLTRFDLQRAEYWRTLYTSVELEAPFLVMCSESDNFAPYQVIHNFSQCLRDLGANVTLITWNGSPHIGHFNHYPIQYRAAVSDLLGKANLLYTQRIKQLALGRTGMGALHDEMSDLICDLQKAAVDSSQSLKRAPLGPDDHLLPSSSGNHECKDSEASQDGWREKSVNLPNPPSMNANSILGQMLFDVCVPKNVEGWDIKFSGSLNGKPYASASKRSAFHSTKHIRRSRL